MYNRFYLKKIFEEKKIICLIVFKLIIVILFLYFINVKKGENLILQPSFKKNIYKMDSIQIYLNHSLYLNEKEKLLKILSMNIGKNIKFVRNIFIGAKTSFDNLLIILTKIISYCQIFECKKIILDKNNYWFIRNKIKIKKYKFIITVDI